MKKTFIAAAVGVAMAAPLSAFAATTLYGQAHASVDFVDDGIVGQGNQVSISSNSSRIGVKGSENVGGMDVVYGIEWQVSISGESKDLGTQRNRYVGLKSADFGTIVVGKMDTPAKKVGRSVDLFHSTQLGENRSLTSKSGGDDRRGDVIQWNSNDMSGFKAAVQYSADSTGDTDNNDFDAFSISGVYTSGDIMVGGAFDSKNAGVELYRLVGKYTMGDIKMVGFYENADEFGAGLVDSTVWGLGASMTNGSNTFKIAYYDASDIKGVAGDDGDLISVGVDHALSSSTMIYVTAADGGDLAAPVGSGHDDKTAAAGTSGVSFGIRTKF
jgi:predicted porin